MSVKQYNRKLSLIAGKDSSALELSEFRVTFLIKRGELQTPNTLDCRIYNLSPQTSNQIGGEFTRIVLQAGYEGNFGVLFDGTIKQVRQGRASQTDTYVDITAADGDRAYNFSAMALSLAAGTTPSDSVQAIIQNMASSGISEGYLPELPKNGRVRGRVFYGMCRDEMREFAKNNNCTWSIQDGKLTMIPLKAYVPGEVPVISADTGLIGMPEQTQNGIHMRLLLNPSIKIGQKIKLDNVTINRYRYGTDFQTNSNEAKAALPMAIKTNADGEYYVMCVDHVGDTHGNDWYTDLICLAVDATVPSEYARRAAVLPGTAILSEADMLKYAEKGE